MLLGRPIEADKPTHLICHLPPRVTCGPPRPLSIPVLALEAQTSYLTLVAAVSPGHMSYEDTRGTGGLWWPPADRPGAPV